MPLAPGVNEFVGLGLWNSVVATIIVEASLFLLGVFIYARITAHVDAKGKITFWTFVGFLAVFWLMNLFGPPPSDVRAIKWGNLAFWLFVPWGYWIDRHRMICADDAGAGIAGK